MAHEAHPKEIETVNSKIELAPADMIVERELRKPFSGLGRSVARNKQNQQNYQNN